MRSPPTYRAILAMQRAWAKSRGLEPNSRGYLARYDLNLRAPLSTAALAAFQNGTGGELIDREGRPAKMLALHSSAALAVNVFDFWTGRDLARVLQALGVHGRAKDFAFERQLRTGAGGTPPNIDVVISLDDGRLIGVESKFTEWMSPKGSLASRLRTYVDRDTSFWSRAELPGAHRLAEAMLAGEETFGYLDVPQLLKHALGLARASAPGWGLRYLYYDAAGAARDAHAAELARFQAAVGAELRFRAITYQAFVDHLLPARTGEEVAYFGYLRERYFRSNRMDVDA